MVGEEIAPGHGGTERLAVHGVGGGLLEGDVVPIVVGIELEAGAGWKEGGQLLLCGKTSVGTPH